MIFIVFDIEVIFLYPYAMVFEYLGSFGLVAIGIFSFAVFESFVYLISNGALEWGPVKRVARPIDQVSHTRTATSTIRRVGTTGREHGQEAAAVIGGHHRTRGRLVPSFAALTHRDVRWGSQPARDARSTF